MYKCPKWYSRPMPFWNQSVMNYIPCRSLNPMELLQLHLMHHDSPDRANYYWNSLPTSRRQRKCCSNKCCYEIDKSTTKLFNFLTFYAKRAIFLIYLLDVTTTWCRQCIIPQNVFHVCLSAVWAINSLLCGHVLFVIVSYYCSWLGTF